METEDLRKFLTVAHHSNLQSAAEALHVTPATLSKMVKRIEQTLNTELFDRVGRNIILNAQGEKFCAYAKHLVHESDQVLSEFRSHQTNHINISGPSVLLQYWLPLLACKLSPHHTEITAKTCWEGAALGHVSSGKSHLAVVTNFENNSEHPELSAIPLATTTFRVVAAENHPIHKDIKSNEITNADLLNHAFACPTISPFCGVKKGVGSDGWRDDKVKRDIKYLCDDFSILLSLVKQGLALAYVPDFIAEQNNFTVINVIDCAYQCTEQIELKYSPSMADGWLNQLLASLRV